MGVDQARQDRHAGNIDDLGLARPLAIAAGFDRFDPLVLDDNRRVDRRGAGPVDHPAAFEHPHHRRPLWPRTLSPTAPDSAISAPFGRSRTPDGPVALAGPHGDRSATQGAAPTSLNGDLRRPKI